METMERRFTFDGVAELYDAARPGYPETLVDQVSRAAGLRPGDRVLEIGCGTGKATRLFAQRGVRVVALEPGSNLIGVARRSLTEFPNIEFIDSTFEEWSPEPATFKLVYAAQSFHWIAPEVQFSKSASVLAPGGFLAVFGNTVMPLDSPLREELERIYARIAPHLVAPDQGQRWYLPGGALSKLFDELPPSFAAPTHNGYSWTWSHTAASFTDFSRTQSDHQLLPMAQREALLSAIAIAVHAQGGMLELQIETNLYMAARKA
jgi:ubiquinone/menaquinone biosynthesis C-methylase UbiE